MAKALSTKEPNLIADYKTRTARLKKNLNTFNESLGEIYIDLKAVRNNRTYKAKYKSFDDYCEQELGFNRNYADKIIRAKDSLIALEDKQQEDRKSESKEDKSEYHGTQNEDNEKKKEKTQKTQKTEAASVDVPTTERQMRELMRVDNEQDRLKLWKEIIKLKESGEVNRITVGVIQKQVDRYIEAQKKDTQKSDTSESKKDKKTVLLDDDLQEVPEHLRSIFESTRFDEIVKEIEELQKSLQQFAQAEGKGLLPFMQEYGSKGNMRFDSLNDIAGIVKRHAKPSVVCRTCKGNGIVNKNGAHCSDCFGRGWLGTEGAKAQNKRENEGVPF